MKDNILNYFNIFIYKYKSNLKVLFLKFNYFCIRNEYKGKK